MAEAKKMAMASVHVTGLDRKRHRQGDSGRRCIFADVMGCQGTHPSWHCKVFGKIRAKEREKIIEDNQLCPFCLLHDKAKPCGAKQRPVNPTCHVPNCKGKHIQKLHELLKDVFKEENQVHLVHGDDGWEESEEAWEVDGEEEVMMVGTIQREDDYSWQDASKSWLEQDEEEEDGTYYAGTCQGAGSAPPETREKQSSAVVCPPTEECENAETEEESWWTPGPEDLLIEGEEREYFLELLMREEAMEELTTVNSKAGQSAKKEETRKNKVASIKGKKKGKGKTPKGGDGATAQPEKKETSAREEEGREGGQSEKQARVAPTDPLVNPEAKGRGLQTRDQPEARPETRSTTTSRGECSRQEKPGS
jgi:hypothetical protein